MAPPAQAAAPLLCKDKSSGDLRAPPVKRRIWFGFLPLWQECVPLDASGGVDWAATLANISIGVLIGLREALGGVQSQTLYGRSDFGACGRLIGNRLRIRAGRRNRARPIDEPSQTHLKRLSPIEPCRGVRGLVTSEIL